MRTYDNVGAAVAAAMDGNARRAAELAEAHTPACREQHEARQQLRGTEDSGMATTRKLPDVRPGQVWADNDKRGYGRRVRVESVGSTHAEVVQVDGRGLMLPNGQSSRIRLDRFRPTSTGYRLVQDVEG